MQHKKLVISIVSLMIVASFVLSACGGAAGPAAPDVAQGYTGTVVKSVPADLVSACKTENMLTIIATPPTWANYGEIFADFQTTTGVKINSLDPNAGSADELAAKTYAHNRLLIDELSYRLHGIVQQFRVAGPGR